MRETGSDALRRYASAVPIAVIVTAAAAAWFEDKPPAVIAALAVAAVVAAFAPGVHDRLRRGAGARVDLASMADDLAVSVLQSLTHSPEWALLTAPPAMPVRIRVAGSDTQSQPITELAGIVRQTRSWQVIVEGPDGSGRTAALMLLVHQLLSPRQPGEPVPVLIDMARWDPCAEGMEPFFIRRLVEDYDIDPAVAQRLISEPRVDNAGSGWWLMPLLDNHHGPDSLFAHMYSDFYFGSLDRYMASGRPLVLVSPPHNAESLLPRPVNRPWSRATTVRLEPLTPDAVVSYLNRPEPFGDGWGTVLDQVSSDPGAPWSRVLSSPLAAWMARRAWRHPLRSGATGNPNAPDDVKAIERWLIDQLIQEAFPFRGNHRRWLENLAWVRWVSAVELATWELDWTRLSHRPETLQVRLLGTTAPLIGLLVAAPTAPLGGGLLAMVLGVFGALLFVLAVGGLLRKVVPHPFQQDSTSGREHWGLITAHWFDTRFGVFFSHTVFGLLCGCTVGAIVVDPPADDPVGVLYCAAAGLAAAWATAALPRPRSRAYRTRRGLGAAVRANHVFASLAALRYAAVAGAAYAVLGASAGPGSWPWALPGAALFAAGGFVAGESGWLEFRLVQLTFAGRWRRVAAGRRSHRVADLPSHVLGFITHAARAEFGLLRISGPYWAFRHRIVADHLEHATQLQRGARGR